MSNWKRTALGSGGGDSPRNVIEFDNDAYSSYSYFYMRPDNLITTKTSGNLFIITDIRPGSSSQQKATIYDPYLNVLANGQPNEICKTNKQRYSYGHNFFSDASIGASGSYGQDDVVVAYTGAAAADTVFVKATGLPSGYNYKETKINNNYYNSSSSWYNAYGYKTHWIGNKAYDMRNHSYDGWAFMSYKYPPSTATSWYSASDIQGQNPGRYVSSGGCNTFEPINPTSMTTDFIVAYSVPYSNLRFKTLDYQGAAKSTGRSGDVSQLSSNFQYHSPGQIDRANSEVFMFDSDAMVLTKWNYSNGTINNYHVQLPGNVNRTQFNYPMVLLNGYLYLMGYHFDHSNGFMCIIRMSASNPTSNYVYKIYNTQGARQVEGFNMAEGPNSALGETDLLTIAFCYRSNSAATRQDMIIANLLFTDLPQLASSGQVGAKLIVQGTTTTITNVNSSYTSNSYTSSSGVSGMYSGNQATGFPGISSQNTNWNSHSASYASGLTKTSL